MSAKVSDEAHAAILLMVSARAVTEARSAWRRARSSSDAKVLRSAFRACVLAERSARKAAAVWSGDTRKMLVAVAKKLGDAAVDLKHRLARAAG